jgi:hypothetical protein
MKLSPKGWTSGKARKQESFIFNPSGIFDSKNTRPKGEDPLGSNFNRETIVSPLILFLWPFLILIINFHLFAFRLFNLLFEISFFLRRFYTINIKMQSWFRFIRKKIKQVFSIIKKA